LKKQENGSVRHLFALIYKGIQPIGPKTKAAFVKIQISQNLFVNLFGLKIGFF
jgi:hypothetical protein